MLPLIGEHLPQFANVGAWAMAAALISLAYIKLGQRKQAPQLSPVPVKAK